MNTLSSLLNFLGETLGANPNTLKTSSKTLVGAINEIAVTAYPIGSYFWTSDGNFNPATEFGGTWELMDEGMVLVSAGQTYPISSGVHKDGGSEYIQEHTHGFTKPTVTGNQPVYSNRNGASGSDRWTLAGSVTSDNFAFGGNYTVSGGSVDAVNDVTTGNAGNMPPYKNAYCWHRTA